jgi:hypothetical protein
MHSSMHSTACCGVLLRLAALQQSQHANEQTHHKLCQHNTLKYTCATEQHTCPRHQPQQAVLCSVGDVSNQTAHAQCKQATSRIVCDRILHIYCVCAITASIAPCAHNLHACMVCTACPSPTDTSKAACIQTLHTCCTLQAQNWHPLPCVLRSNKTSAVTCLQTLDPLHHTHTPCIHGTVNSNSS